MKKILLLIIATIIIGVLGYWTYLKTTKRVVVILLYDKFTMLDAVGAYQTFSGLMMKNYQIKTVAKSKGKVKSSHLQSLYADYSLNDIMEADILYIPGGDEMSSIINDTQIINWIKK